MPRPGGRRGGDGKAAGARSTPRPAAAGARGAAAVAAAARGRPLGAADGPAVSPDVAVVLRAAAAEVAAVKTQLAARAVGRAGVGATRLSSAPGAPFVSALRVLIQWGGDGRQELAPAPRTVDCGGERTERPALRRPGWPRGPALADAQRSFSWSPSPLRRSCSVRAAGGGDGLSGDDHCRGSGRGGAGAEGRRDGGAAAVSVVAEGVGRGRGAGGCGAGAGGGRVGGSGSC